jgi:hypothetical protein
MAPIQSNKHIYNNLFYSIFNTKGYFVINKLIIVKLIIHKIKYWV